MSACSTVQLRSSDRAGASVSLDNARTRGLPFLDGVLISPAVCAARRPIEQERGELVKRPSQALLQTVFRGGCMHSFCRALSLSLLTGSVAVSGAAAAQEYPTRVIRIVVAQAPASGPDLT